MTARRRLLFWAVLAATPLALLASAELAARLLVRASIAEDPRINLVDVPSFFERRVVDGREYYEVSHPEAYRGRQTRFLAEKPSGTLRIFCLGGSASAGWPHPPSEIYSAYLQQALERALPERPVEVINASAHAYAAYRVRLVFDNVIEHEPDVLVIYSGNNEFLERRSYRRRWPGLERAAAVANRLVLFRLMRREIARVLEPGNVLSAQRREHVAEGLRTKLAQLPSDLREDPERLREVTDHYAASLEAMVREAGERGVPVVLLTVPVNLRDWHPNVSLNRLAGEELLAWERVYDAGRGALLAGEPAGAVERFDRALELEPLHAETYFQRGRALEALGRMPEAFASYEAARDLDHNPFRALGAFNAILRDLAARHPHVVLADAEAAFAGASAPRAPGFDLFLDYVHPTREGNRILARVVFDALVAGALVHPTHAGFAVPLSDYDESRDARVQLALLALFTTMHQYEAMVAQARRLESLGADARGMARQVLAVFPDYLEAERRRLLGAPLPPEETARLETAVQRFYERELRAVAGGG